MKLTCKVFGHRIEDGDYMEVIPHMIDGRYIRIAEVEVNCKRCNISFKIGNIRFPDVIHDEMMEKMRKKIVLKSDSSFISTIRETMRDDKKVMTTKIASVIRMDLSFREQKTKNYVVQYFDFTRDNSYNDQKITNLNFVDAMTKHNELVKNKLSKTGSTKHHKLASSMYSKYNKKGDK